MSENNLFQLRLDHHRDELRKLYLGLYHDEKAFEYFLSMLERMYRERSLELRQWDHKRGSDPNWYRRNDILGTLMYVDCFKDNLRGIIDNLDYLEETGINYLHMMPLLTSPEGKNDGGYAVSDFRTVDPRLGSMDDLSELASKCHENNISLCLDFVMNHTSDEHEWARKARSGEKEYQDRYFFFDDWDIPEQYEKTVPQVFPTTAPGNFTYCKEAGKVVMTTFYPYQWDLNYGNPKEFNDLTENMLYLCNKGIDIIRLDATPYIWKELGTSCRNLPQVHQLVRIMHIAAQIVCPSVLLLGEVVMEPSKVVPYFGTVEKPECHLLYNVTTMATMWHTVATKDVRLLRHQLEAVYRLPKQYVFLNYLRCHDDIGWGLDYEYLEQFGITEALHKEYLNDYLTGHYHNSDSRGELYNNDPKLRDARLCGTTASLCGLEAAEQQFSPYMTNRAVNLDLMLHAFLLSQSGIPVLYSGDEVGQLNDYSYHLDPKKADDSRYVHRGKMRWDLVEQRHDYTTPAGRIYQGIQTLRKIRNEHPLFMSPADTWILEPFNDHVLAIGRYYQDEKLIALINFSEMEETAWINEPEYYTNLLTGEVSQALSVNIPACDFVWLYHSYKEEQ